MFATDLTDETRAMLVDAEALSRRGEAASGAEACRMACEDGGRHGRWTFDTYRGISDR
jgi:hypothetical protein